MGKVGVGGGHFPSDLATLVSAIPTTTSLLDCYSTRYSPAWCFCRCELPWRSTKCVLPVSGGSSRRAAALPEKCVRQKIPLNGQTRLKFGFSYENFTTQSLSVPTPFWLNVSKESNKTNVSLFANDAAYPMTFSAHLPMNLAISGLSSAQP